MYERPNKFFFESHPGINEIYKTGMIEGIPVTLFFEEEIFPGDTYIAERNQGVKLLTCRTNNKDRWWIVPVEKAYVYDTGECIKIKFNIDKE